MKIQTSLKQLLVSQTRLKIITILFANPKEIYYVRQLVRLTEEEINSVRRELDNLKKAGIIGSEWRGNRLYYWADKQSPVFYDLLILANKNSGLGLKLQHKNETLSPIKLVLYNYKFAVGEKRNQDGIDLIIVGDLFSLKEVDILVKEEEKIRGHEINYMVMDKNEFQMRKQKRDQFIVDFFLSCPVVIIGSSSEIVSI
jgi:DNA-binding transcriptional ArsR family regulator